ncbi:MAG TPA: hypothetical protein VMB25_01760 [Bryobacteraceae bacterium]|nr:hypothetical protein [Bryobacteraceae bacterium]
MNAEPRYRRLPGRAGVFIRHSLWMGPDHLLRVRANPFAEEYRRYYFKDIQALVLTELAHPAAYFLYTFSAFFAILFVALISSGHPAWATLCALSALLLFWLGVRIPDCATRILTRVSSDRLPSLKKLPSTRKALAIVHAGIAQTQGELDAAALQPHLSAHTAPPPAVSPQPELHRAEDWAHWTLFGCMLFRSVLILLALAFTIRSVAYSLLGDAVGAAVLLAGVLALLQQHRAKIARGVHWLVYGSLLWQAVSFVASVGLTGYVGFQLAMKRTTALTMLESTGRLYQAADAAAYFLLASVGIYLLWQRRFLLGAPPAVTGEVTTLDHQ